MNRMVANADRALRQVLELRKSEKVLIITDKATRAVASAWAKAADRLGAVPVKYIIPEHGRPLAAVPEDLAALTVDADIAITVFSSRPGETPFRIELLGMLGSKARRIAHCPGIDTGMMTDGGMSADFPAMAATARELIRRLSQAVSAHITAPGGTELLLDIRNRPFSTDTIVADGAACNLPCGEIWCAPDEGNANGVLVCDGCAGELGVVPAPVKLVINNGRVTSVHCLDEGFRQDVEALLEFDSGAAQIGEFGIGLNPAARLGGKLLEDEKAAGTAHIAFGNNISSPGGRNRSRTHQDFLFYNPTVTVQYDDGREEPLMVAGRIARQRQPRGQRSGGLWGDVMVIADFSPASEEAVLMADTIARQNDARLLCCHIVNNPVQVNMLMPQYSAMTNNADTIRHSQEEAVRGITAMVAHLTHRTPDEFEVQVFAGDPLRSILECAEGEGIDLIVVPSQHALPGTRRYLAAALKSLADQAACDVLVVR